MLAAGTRFSVTSTILFNGPSSPSIAPFTSVTEPSISSTNVPATKSDSSEQSQLPFSTSRTKMTSTIVTISTTPTSESPSVLPSSVPQSSATVSSSSSPNPSSVSGTSGGDGSSSTSESSDPSTIPSTTAATTAALTSPPTTTFHSDTTTSTSTSISAVFSTLDTSSSTIAFPTSSGLSSQDTSLEINMPLTTVLRSTTIVITSTNSQGEVVTSVPPVVTEIITTTGNGGVATTVTQAVINPTLAPDNSTSGESAFFADTGAVVGVFVVVGLACAAILLWIVFAVRHRQHMARIEQETAVEAAVAAAGLHRAPLDDDEGDSPILPNTRHQFRPFSARMGQRSFWGMGSSASLPPPSARHSEALSDPARDAVNLHTKSTVKHHPSNHPEGYVPARTTSPSSLNRVEQGTYDLSSSRDRKSSYGHTPTYSAGSFEPLLANYTQNMSDQDTSADIVEVPRTGTSSAPNRSSLDGEDMLRTSLRQDSSGSYVLRDGGDKGYVLMVRNLPDNQSQHSL